MRFFLLSSGLVPLTLIWFALLSMVDAAPPQVVTTTGIFVYKLSKITLTLRLPYRVTKTTPATVSPTSTSTVKNLFGGAYQSFRGLEPSSSSPSIQASPASTGSPSVRPSSVSSSTALEASTVTSSPTTAELSTISSPTTASESSTSSSLSSSSSQNAATSSIVSAGPSAMAYVPPPPMKFAEGSSVIVPRVRFRTFHGISINEPSSQYVKMKHEASPKLDDSLLTVGVNDKITTGYDLAVDTGIIAVDESTKHLLADLKEKPHLSRDGGKGGYLNGQKLFLFCDTGAYTPAKPGKPGDFLGFVSGSVAIDKGGKGTNSEPLVLEDGVGQWSDDVGRMRGMSPLTAGEQSYNMAMQGKGQRYAIWPESSIVPFNHTHALLYGAIVYDNVNRATRKTVFTYTGTTLLMITAPVASGPRADRLVEKLFRQEEVEWGTIGAFRSYGASGPGGNDGRVYVLGKASEGLLIGRVDAGKIEDRGSLVFEVVADLPQYEYWDGKNWTPDIQPRSSTAHFIKGAYMDGDLFYSPTHLTFIFIYLTPYADSTFFFRYLKADRAIRPSTDGSYDFAEDLVKYEWSEEQMLYKAPHVPEGKYIYAGGAHQGYYDAEDITNGGRMTLLSWTVPTGKEPGEVESEYSHVTAHVEWE